MGEEDGGGRWGRKWAGINNKQVQGREEKQGGVEKKSELPGEAEKSNTGPIRV